jgi:hypothetical protein
LGRKRTLNPKKKQNHTSGVGGYGVFKPKYTTPIHNKTFYYGENPDRAKPAQNGGNYGFQEN